MYKNVINYVKNPMEFINLINKKQILKKNRQLEIKKIIFQNESKLNTKKILQLL